jgi:putative transposase
VKAGSTVEGAAKEVGVDPRTVQRWKERPDGDDRRAGPRTKPDNALSRAEKEKMLAVANSAGLRDKSPHQIVAILADRGEYLASESSFYRVLREAKQLAHRGRTRPRTPRPIPVHTATGPQQLVSWDITYLPTVIRGQYYFLYLFLDVWSRKVVGWQVHEREDDTLAAGLLAQMAATMKGVAGLVIHSDNGGPMRGAMMLAKMRELGAMPSFSRPRVSNDNPFSEAAFRTLKYVPFWPDKPFASLEAARAWVAHFVAWYNDEHRHSALDYLTPSERHAGRGEEILAHRRAVYERARRARPTRWSRGIRRWHADAEVTLNRPRMGRRSESRVAALT